MTLIKFNRERKEITTVTAFQGEKETLLDENDIDEQYNNQLDLVLRRLKFFIHDGSDWTVRQKDNLELHFVSYKPITGSSYITTPKFIANKNAIINIKNNDSKCFVWSILAALHPACKNTNRVSKYKPCERELIITNLKSPLAVKDLKKIEKLNRFISVSVLAFDGKACIYPVHVTNEKYRSYHANLLLINDNDKFHYCLIKNMSRLLCTNRKNGRRYFCHYCLY